METDETKETKSVFVVLIKNNEILLVENAPKFLPNGSLKPLGWGLPGGGLLPQEGEIAGAIREVEEETGYIVSSLNLLDYEPKGNHVVYILSGVIIKGHLKTSASDDTIMAAWFPISKLPSGIYKSHKKRIENALKTLL